MSDHPQSANNNNKPPETVVQQVLEAFYSTLSAKPEYKDIADRLMNETSHSETAIRRALFGKDCND